MTTNDPDAAAATLELAWACARRLRAAGLVDLADALAAAARADHGDRPPAREQRAPAAALAHLPHALDLADAAIDPADLTSAARRATHGATWTQNPGYAADPPDPGFLDAYAQTSLLGPAASGPVVTGSRDDVLLGLLLLGPRTHYPPHHHPAEEVYLPLLHAEWSHADADPLHPHPSGSLVHHPAYAVHAMRTSGAPLLAVFVWHGDVATPARLTGR